MGLITRATAKPRRDRRVEAVMVDAYQPEELERDGKPVRTPGSVGLTFMLSAYPDDLPVVATGKRVLSIAQAEHLYHDLGLALSVVREPQA